MLSAPARGKLRLRTRLKPAPKRPTYPPPSSSGKTSSPVLEHDVALRFLSFNARVVVSIICRDIIHFRSILLSACLAASL